MAPPLRAEARPIFSEQYHLGASPGLHDSDYLLRRFIKMMTEGSPVGGDAFFVDDSWSKLRELIDGFAENLRPALTLDIPYDVTCFPPPKLQTCRR